MYANLRPTCAKLNVFCGPLGGAGGPSLGSGPMVKNTGLDQTCSHRVKKTTTNKQTCKINVKVVK